MPLTIWNCVLSYKHKNYFGENQLAVSKITSITEFPGSNFLQPTCLTDVKWDFRWQIWYLLLLISNPVISLTKFFLTIT